MLRRFLHLAGVLLLSGSSAALLAADEPPAPEAVAVSRFKPPKVQTSGLRESIHRRADGEQGWAEVYFMVTPKGVPYEITVVESSGSERFESAVIDAIKNWQYEPAMLGNTPVESSISFRVFYYDNELANEATLKFSGRYKRLTKAIEAGDRAQADEILASLETENVYEDAYRNLAVFRYHRKWGTEAQQIVDLRRAVNGERMQRALSREHLRAALNDLLILEVKTNDYARALKTWEQLRPLAAPKMIAGWQPAIDAINAAKTSDRPYRMAAQIVKGRSWYGELFRKRFSLEVSKGNVTAIKLRCEKRYVYFPYDPAIQYTVDSGDGSCGIEVMGELGTTFDLVQS